MWVPLKKKKKTKQKGRRPCVREKDKWQRVDFLKFLFFSNLSSQIYENLTVGIRRDKHKKYSIRRGLRMGTRNTRFHREFR